MGKTNELLDSEQALHYLLSLLGTKAGYVYSRWRDRHPPHQPTRKNTMYRNQRLVFVAAALLLVAAFGNFSLLSAGQTISSAGLVSYYAVQRTATPIVVDGSLGEFAWQAAEQIDGFERILSDYDRVLSPVRAKMLWDDEHFYFGFACRDPDIWAIYANEDDHLWEEEVVEVFIDPDGDGENYLELEVNPLNAVVDLLIYHVRPSSFKSSIEWDIAGLQTAVQVQGTVNDSLSRDLGWAVEIAIPWAAMVDSVDGGKKPERGDTWRLNLYRIDRTAGRNLKSSINDLRGKIAALLEESGVDEMDQLNPEQQKKLEKIRTKLDPLQERHHKQTEYTAWSETFQHGFHHPARFGVVQFVE